MAVRFDLLRLGDIAGLDTVHLQCHIGTDTVSLGRRGARSTGLDLPAPAIDQARALAAAAGVEMQLKDRPERLSHSYSLEARRVR